MKTIVIEGHDNSGKSTLAKEIQSWLEEFEILESSGPPLSSDEINSRVMDINDQMDNNKIILVRHPVISNAVYGSFRPEGDPILPELREAFYARKDLLIIYADQGDRGLTGHSVKSHDTPEHQALLETKNNQILQAYREWAIKRAHLIYRIGDDLSLIKGAAVAFIDDLVF